MLQKLKDVQSYARIPPSVNQVRDLSDNLGALLYGQSLILPITIPAMMTL